MPSAGFGGRGQWAELRTVNRQQRMSGVPKWKFGNEERTGLTATGSAGRLMDLRFKSDSNIRRASIRRHTFVTPMNTIRLISIAIIEIAIPTRGRR